MALEDFFKEAGRQIRLRTTSDPRRDQVAKAYEEAVDTQYARFENAANDFSQRQEAIIAENSEAIGHEMARVERHRKFLSGPGAECQLDVPAFVPELGALWKEASGKFRGSKPYNPEMDFVDMSLLNERLEFLMKRHFSQTAFTFTRGGAVHWKAEKSDSDKAFDPHAAQEAIDDFRMRQDAVLEQNFETLRTKINGEEKKTGSSGTECTLDLRAAIPALAGLWADLADSPLGVPRESNSYYDAVDLYNRATSSVQALFGRPFAESNMRVDAHGVLHWIPGEP